MTRKICFVKSALDPDDDDASLSRRSFGCAFSGGEVHQKTIYAKKKKKRTRNTMILLSSFLNRKPCRRVFVLALVLVVVPLSGRMFYRHKLEFARRMSSSSSRLKKVVLEEEQQRVGQQQREEREEEEKRLVKLEGNPNNVADERGRR